MKLIAILSIVLAVIKLTISNCYWSENCHYKNFSSKTPYQFVRGDIRDSIVKIKGCNAISVWGLVRHGKRNPGIDFVQNMLDAITMKYAIKLNHENSKGSMCAQDVENLYNWEADPNMFKNVHHIAYEGYQEMFGIGHRIRKAFRDLLTSLDDQHYKLRSAYGGWVENGVKGFVEGFGNTSMIIEKSNVNYDIIAPYKACSFYIKAVRNNKETYAEANKYQNTSEYFAVKNRIQQRTGIDYTLTDENITALYDLCRYTSSGLDNKLSPWCAIFNKEDIQAVEYVGDLKHFYRNSYGTPINKIFGRIPLADLLESFKAAKNGKGKKLTVYFTHATMMDMVYSALGLFKDKIPLNSTFRNPERKWRSSKIAPFAANLIVNLNRCTNGESTYYNVVFYMNEKPLKSICDEGVCSWEDFEIKLKPFINTTTNFCCEPISIWGLLRHGKRYPSVNFGRKMEDALAIRDYVISSYEKGHSFLCAQDIEDLKNWSVDKKMLSESNHLTPEGYEEMFGIAKRLKEAFPALLKNLEKGSFTIRPAFGIWIENCAKAFANGLQSKNVHIEKALSDSDVMAPYLTCGKYQMDVLNNSNIFAEAEKYKTSPEYLAAKDRIQRRSGIDYILTDTNITALYDLCRHTWSGIENKLSPWCALFSKDDLEVLEYIDDLKAYYKSGYGSPKGDVFGRITLTDLLNNFQRTKDGGKKKITAYFTHATTLEMVYAALGLFKDSKPLGSAYRERGRKWRTSFIAAYAVNLVAVLNRCVDNEDSDYKVVFYLNEEPIRSICADGICTWMEFEDKLSPFLNTTIDFCEFRSEPF